MLLTLSYQLYVINFLLLTFIFKICNIKKLERMNPLQKNSQVSQISAGSKVGIVCAFHKDTNITNFCSSQSCLLPMCPTCVSIHSQQHRQERTHGQFMSIDQVIQNISALLLKTNKNLEDLSEQYTEDYWNKQKILESCKQTLKEQKKHLIKEIQRKFQEIQYKMTRKINEFQDHAHDRYRQLESEIQYLYDSLNKQRQDFQSSSDKILRNVIQFYAQRKEQKIKDWLSKFRIDVSELKKQSIKIKCNEELFDLVKSIDYYFNIQEFKDQENQYLISTGRDLITSNTKRKRVESPRWSDDKENCFTVRTKNNKNVLDITRSPINELTGTHNCNQNNPVQWSASKF